MKSCRGFTLWECLVALIVVSGFTLIVQLALSTIQRQTFFQRDEDRLNWYRFKSTLTGDNLALQFVSQDKQLVLYSPITMKKYQLIYNSEEQLLKLTGEKNGYLPLLYQVSTCQIKVQDSYLSIKVGIHNCEYQMKYYLLKAGEVYEK